MWHTDWTSANGKSCHTAIVRKKRLEVVYGDSSGEWSQFPGGAIGEVWNIDNVMANPAILEMEQRRIPGKSEGVGSGMKDTEVCGRTCGVCMQEEKHKSYEYGYDAQ